MKKLQMISSLVLVLSLMLCVCPFVSAQNTSSDVNNYAGFHAPTLRKMIEVNLKCDNVDEEFFHLLANAYLADPELLIKTIIDLPQEDITYLAKAIAYDLQKTQRQEQIVALLDAEDPGIAVVSKLIAAETADTENASLSVFLDEDMMVGVVVGEMPDAELQEAEELAGATLTLSTRSPDVASIDWSNIDLENYDYSQLEIEQWGSLGDWLREEADLHTVFYITTTKGDGWIGEMWSDIVSSLFMKKPVSFIQALALEDEATQRSTYYRVLYWVPDDKDGFAQLMRDLLQADIFTDAEKNVVKKIIVRAEERNINIMIRPKTDWSKIDLENYDYSDFEMEQWQSLRDWLQEDADLHTVFYVTTTKGDGYVGELWADLVYSLFMEDPVLFIQALALEDESTQNLTSSRIAFVAPRDRDEFKELMHELVQTDVFTDSEQEVLKKIITFTEENTDIDISVEEHRAGGYIILAVLIVVVSGLAVVLLVKLRKPRDKEIGTE